MARGRRRRRRRRAHGVRARLVDEDVLRVDEEHPRLVHLAPAVVGPPHPGVVLRPCGDDHGRARAIRRPASGAAARAAAGRGRPRHLVLVGAVAVLDAGLAGRRTRDLARYYPTTPPDHRLRHHLLLGRPHDDVRAEVHGRGPVPAGLHPRPRARRRRAEDVQVEGEHHRPRRRAAPLRHRRGAPDDGDAGGARERHPPGARAHGGYRAFANKLWNACRFVLDEGGRRRCDDAATRRSTCTLVDRWILARTHAVIGEVDRSLESAPVRSRRGRALPLRVGTSSATGTSSCVKPDLGFSGRAGDRRPIRGARRWRAPSSSRCSTRSCACCTRSCPFVTEELWQKFPHTGTTCRPPTGRSGRARRGSTPAPSGTWRCCRSSS